MDKLVFLKIKNFCSEKDPGKEDEKTSYSLGENICEPHIQKKISIKNVYGALKTQQ